MQITTESINTQMINQNATERILAAICKITGKSYKVVWKGCKNAYEYNEYPACTIKEAIHHAMFDADIDGYELWNSNIKTTHGFPVFRQRPDTD